MTNNTSLVRRIAQGSVLAASAAVVLSAFATTGLSAYLLTRAEDRRVSDAAVTLAVELEHAPATLEVAKAIQIDESEEMAHTGLSFSIYDPAGVLLAGDPRFGLPSQPGCENTNGGASRTCRSQTSLGYSAVAAAPTSSKLPLLALAAVLSALLAATLAWFASRPISRLIIDPLTRLRDRVAEVDISELSKPQLGLNDGVLEVDALRNTIGQLIARVEHALELAHRFAANAAHELRTPLASVRGLLELLSESIQEPALREDASRAEQKLAELSLLVERLLVLSVPARTLGEAHELVSVRDLFEDTLATLPLEEQERVELSHADALIKGDGVLLATMVSNAVANALKFGHRVKTGTSVTDGEVVLQIDDDGPGIDVGERERLFEPFFRSADALRRRIPGHGLGLALIRHIALTHRGSAAFVDKPEPGTRLEIRLPAIENMSSGTPH